MRAETPLPCPYRAGTGKVWTSPCPYEPLPCPYRPLTGMFSGSGGDNKSERKKWRSMEVIMSMCGVPMEVSGCDNNVERNWRYKWIKNWLSRWVNAMKMVDEWKWWERRMKWRQKCMNMTRDEYSDDEVFTRNTEGDHFVVQPAGSAPDPTGSAQTGNVSSIVMCVTATTTVATVLTKETAVSWWLWQSCWCWW